MHVIFYIHKIDVSTKRVNECVHLKMRSGPRLIVECSIFSVLDCVKIIMASDQLGHAGCTAQRPGGGIILGSRNSGRSWCVIRRLIVVF